MITLSRKVKALIPMEEWEEEDEPAVNAKAIFSEMFHPRKWSQLYRGKTSNELITIIRDAITAPTAELAGTQSCIQAEITPMLNMENAQITLSEGGSYYLQSIYESKDACRLFVVQAYRQPGSLFCIDAGSLPDSEAETLSLAMACTTGFSIESPHSMLAWCNRFTHHLTDAGYAAAGDADQLIQTFPWLKANGHKAEQSDPEVYFQKPHVNMLLEIILNPAISFRAKDLAKRIFKAVIAAETMYTTSFSWSQSLSAAGVFDKDKAVNHCLDDIEEIDQENDGLVAIVEARNIIPFMCAFARHEKALMEIRKWN
ncbi:MAG: hypothetical protein ACYDCW_07585 [Acidithiobacillus ferrivorans]